ncbi:flagellar basal body P-ring biosynthesis protein FlgA [Brachybacterium phenoliresistens]|uniref:Flagellar basal body P-ring biosynthesis protein FlgA n=1 Tax=Brachybacterium phenoliresistens TaxID=396014 RepID=Z9JS57_9MICO|nr:SAF domain-containing protein [Brachybacterium phenoliresistens]EWS80572.1 flagellar basal body P-ring biosynthesis protein FlgA [Brachybacterium phenoliresistens]
MLERFRAAVPHWRRALRRRRRLLTLLALAAALVAVLPGMLPPSARGVEVLVAARSLPAGSVIAAEDLRRERVAGPLVPEGALQDPAQATGRVVRHEIVASTPVLPGHLASAEETVAVDGRSRMVVPLNAALAPHVGTGTSLRIVLSGSDPGTPRTVTAQVLEAPSDPAAAGGRASLPAAGAQVVPLVVVLAPQDVPLVAQAMREGWVSVTIFG